MSSIYLNLIVATLSTQHVCKKAFNQKMQGKGVITFSALSSFAAALFFIFQLKLPFNMDAGVLPYAFLFGAGYGSAALFSVLAISCGSLSLTSLITSYSLIIPTLYGLVFKGDKISIFLIIGLILLMISLFLINFVKDNTRNNKINIKWLIFVIIAFLGNGLCSTAQNAQVEAFKGAYKNEFMTVALIFVVVALLIAGLIRERENIVPSVKKGIVPIFLCGAANGACNLMVMILSSMLPASVMYPLVSAGSIILTYFISKLWYKEKLSLIQNIGFALGVTSVVFLNL